MKPTVKLSGKDNRVKFAKDLQDLSKLQVYVGIPESATARQKAGKGITNAQLAFVHTKGVRTAGMRSIMQVGMNRGLFYDAAFALYIHTYGSPLWRIPPRPIIEPAIEAKGNIEPIREALKQAAAAALAGKKSEALRHLQFAGMTAQNKVRDWFTDPRNNWAPNAPSTIKRKGSSKPLIDTGGLRKSITYIVSQG